MSIHDRDYYREGHGPGWSLAFLAPKWILIGVTAGAFVVQAAVENGRGPEGEMFLLRHVALSLQGILRGELWQPVTYLLLHRGLGHLFWNMLGLWVFASVLEDRLLPAEQWRLYLLGGLGGAAGHLAWGAAGLPGGHLPVIGASGAVTAVLVLASLRAPRAPVLLLFVPVPLWVVGALFVGKDLVEALAGTAGEVAVQAHLGGAAAGALLHLWARRRRGRPAAARVSRRERIAEDDALAPSPDPEDSRVDALLERIHASGIGSLNEEEREFLKRASERYRGKRGT